MRNYRSLWKYSGKYKKHLALLPLAVFLSTAVEIWIPYLMGDMLDKGLNEKDMNNIIHIGVLMIIASLLLVFFGFLESYLVSTWSVGFTRSMRDELFSHLQSLSDSDVDEYGSAAILTRMSTDMNFIKKALGMYNSLLRCPLMILCTIIMTVRVYPSVSWIFIAAAFFFGFIMIFIVKASLKHYGKMFENYDKLNSVLEENVTAEKTIKAFARERHEEERFDIRARNLRREATISEEITVLNEPFLHLVMNICVLIITYVGGKNIIAGRMQSGDFFCVISYVNDILVQIYIVALILVPILSAQISLRRIFDIVEKKPSIGDEGCGDTAPQNGEVTFENVCFGYYEGKDKQILQDINFDIKSGEFIGVIGSSGSGKTTLINLLPRFYDISGGNIYIGGQDIHKMSLRNLRESIGRIPQKSILFTGTIKENLYWGAPDAKEEDIIHACKVANADGFISSFPDGYDTLVGESGSTVSGGQRQRLCIARALLRKPKILIFDDSLSAVDNTTEQSILKELGDNYKDTTLILVSQRFTSVKSADRIIVLGEGGVDAIGTHDELLSSSKIYREIYESQNKMID